MITPGQKLCRGGEFTVYELGDREVLKVPRRSLLRWIAFGDLRRKTESDLYFLRRHFGEFLPATEIVPFGRRWAVRQARVDGTPFSESPVMSPSVRAFLEHARHVYGQTLRIPDLLRSRNLLCERGTGRLLLVDVSVFGGERSWPVGYWVMRKLGRLAARRAGRWLRSGFRRPRRASPSEGPPGQTG